MPSGSNTIGRRTSEVVVVTDDVVVVDGVVVVDEDVVGNGGFVVDVAGSVVGTLVDGSVPTEVVITVVGATDVSRAALSSPP